MKKSIAILAILVVLFTIGVTVVNAASIERHCEDRCAPYLNDVERYGICFDDCMREFEN